MYLIIIFVFQQKIQSDLASHEMSLEEMKKRNRGKDAAKRVLSQIDVAQVKILFPPSFHHTHKYTGLLHAEVFLTYVRSFSCFF